MDAAEIDACTHIFAWKNGPWPDNPKRASLTGRRCQILASGAKRSLLIEFENGQREIVDRYALKPIPITDQLTLA